MNTKANVATTMVNNTTNIAIMIEMAHFEFGSRDLNSFSSSVIGYDYVGNVGKAPIGTLIINIPSILTKTCTVSIMQ